MTTDLNAKVRLKYVKAPQHPGETVFRVGPETRTYTSRVACPRCHRAQWLAFEHRGQRDGFACAHCGFFRET